MGSTPNQPPPGPSCLVTQPFVIWGGGATCQRSDGIAKGLPPLLTLLIHRHSLSPLIYLGEGKDLSSFICSSLEKLLFVQKGATLTPTSTPSSLA